MNQLKIILFLIIPTIAFSQNVNGLVIDSKSNEPLPYVNIGIPYKSIGTVSNNFGEFEMHFNDSLLNDTLVFSMIGYEDFKIKLADINDKISVSLKPKSYDLPTIEIIPFTKSKRIGKRIRNKRYVVGFNDKKLGSELACLLKIKRKSQISSISFSVSQCKFDSITFRLNIYDTKLNSYPNNNLLYQPYYFTLYKKDENSIVSISIQDLSLIVEDDIIVSIEALQDIAMFNVNFKASLFTGKCFTRDASQGAWKKYPFGIGFMADILVN